MMINGSGEAISPPKHRTPIWAVIIIISALLVAGIWLVLTLVKKPAASHTNSPAIARDTVPPTVTLQTPLDNQTVSGKFTLKVNARDNRGVQKVEYYLDKVFIGVTYAKPFDFELDTSKLTSGQHALVAKAFDAAGNVSSSQTVTFTVDNTAPTAGPLPAASDNSASGGGTINLHAASFVSSILGGGPVSAAPDTIAPTVPASLTLSASDGYTANVGWAASTDNVGVASYQVYRDGALLATTASADYQDETVVPGNTYVYDVTATDAAGNVSAASTQPSITLVPTTNWLSAESPSPGSFDNSPGALELGVKFKPLVNGQVTGIRFYKASGSTGTHTGTLWTSGGTQLATVTFTGETASGWQQAAFSSPVSVTAGTTYVASYFVPNGGYGYASAYFTSVGLTSQYLTAPASGGPDGSNGVFNNGAAGFPTSSFDNTYYWVDVAFAPNKNAGGPAPKLVDNSKIYPGYPGSNNTGVPVGLRLPTHSRTITIYNDNTVLEDAEVNADVNILANNVIMRNIRVTSPTSLIWAIKQAAGYSGLDVEDTEMYGDGIHQLQYGVLDSGTAFTGKRLNIHTMTQGVQSNVNVLLQDSYIHDQIYFSGDHTGGYLSTGGDNITIDHNTLQNPLNQTAVLALFCDFAPVTNVTAENNLLIGGGYSFYAPPCTGSSNIHVINNQFSREVWPNGGFNGPVALWNPARPGDQWTNNTWLDDGTPVVP